MDGFRNEPVFLLSSYSINQTFSQQKKANPERFAFIKSLFQILILQVLQLEQERALDQNRSHHQGLT